MKQAITVTFTDESTATGTITPLAQVAFERHFGIGIAALGDTSTMRMEHMYWLAWQTVTAGRQGRPEFDAWLATVADCNFDAGDGDVPLDGTQPSGSSSPSPSSPVPG